MPIYEYRRQDGTTFDVMQKFTDAALTEDPDTGQPVEKVLHAPAIHFKGKGFHNTDYGTRRRNRELEKAGSGGSSEGSSDASSSGSSSEGSGSSGAEGGKTSDSSSSSSSASSESASKGSSSPSPKADKAA